MEANARITKSNVRGGYYFIHGYHVYELDSNERREGREVVSVIANPLAEELMFEVLFAAVFHL
jgi:hypothetical protein